MESFLLTTTGAASSHPLICRNSSASISLPSFSSSVVGSSRKVVQVERARRSRIGTGKTKAPCVVAAAASGSKGRGGGAKVVADGLVGAVGAEEVKEVSWKDVQFDYGSVGPRQPKPSEVDREKQMKYLTKILGSNVYDVAIESPMQYAPLLSQQLGVNLWLKREDMQQIFSFKIRGAYNMISQLPKELLEKGVICASAGNHAQGVAFSAKRLKCTADIVMPKTTPQIKIDAVERMGGIVDLCGNTFDEAQARAKERSQSEGKTFIPPFDDEDVIAGQGTVGMEIARQMSGEVHAIFIPVGGGGLISGIASFYKMVYPEVKIFGVEPNDANSMAQALYRGKIVNVTDIGHFADGVAVQQVGEETFRICNELVDGMMLVSKEMTAGGVKDMFTDERSILEPSGALTIAAVKEYIRYYGITGVNVVVVTSGANMNFDQLCDIAELANLGQESESMHATVLPEQPGSLKAFIDKLDVNINEFSYRYNSDKEAIVLYKVGAAGSKVEQMVKRLESSQFKTYSFSDNPVVQDHFRYLMGGRSNVKNEVLCRFKFPERPGALKHFLNALSPRWNISLFHHRQKGVLSSEVLAGFQVHESEMDEFHGYVKKVGYRYEVVDGDNAAHLLAKL